MSKASREENIEPKKQSSGTNDDQWSFHDQVLLGNGVTPCFQVDRGGLPQLGFLHGLVECSVGALFCSAAVRIIPRQGVHHSHHQLQAARRRRRGGGVSEREGRRFWGWCLRGIGSRKSCRKSGWSSGRGRGKGGRVFCRVSGGLRLNRRDQNITGNEQ